MKHTGNLRKMEAFLGKVIQYHLPVGEQRIDMNQLIGSRIRMQFTGTIHCIRCGRVTSRSFAQGFCYPCFITAPETEECVLNPEMCRAHEGVARDMEYATRHCLTEHVVYLSLTSGLKVGVTRHTQVPTRWIDQGAVRAIVLARTPNRHTAGLIEVELKTHLNDKTNWRLMLTGPGPTGTDLEAERARVSKLLPDNLRDFLVSGGGVLELVYPVNRYPDKIRSLNFDKDPVAGGVLSGIKGQYLIFQDDRVINIRNFGGYQVEFQVD
jgi:hypothetical protein